MCPELRRSCVFSKPDQFYISLQTRTSNLQADGPNAADLSRVCHSSQDLQKKTNPEKSVHDLSWRNMSSIAPTSLSELMYLSLPDLTHKHPLLHSGLLSKIYKHPQNKMHY